MKYIIKEILGSKICLISSDLGLSKQLLEHGAREQASTDFIKKILRPDWTVIDIGSNLGYYALLEAKICRFVYAIEPIGESVEALKESIKLNGYKNIKVYRLAISDKDGYAEIRTSRRSNWATMVDESKTQESYREKFNRFKSVTQKIDTMTLDSFVEFEGIEKIDFIRMDVEGYEVEIVKGIDKTFKLMPSGSHLSVEFHPAIFKDRSNLIDTLDRILKNGFEIVRITTHDRSYLPDDVNLRKWLLEKGACPQVFFVKT
ncbi:MAG: FkbM family methyltransferase [Candidatus Heimdallarchaeaceae archaeon]